MLKNGDNILGCRPLKIHFRQQYIHHSAHVPLLRPAEYFHHVTADSNNLSAVTRQVLEEIQNHNHILREQISELTERDIRTAHSYSMDDVISPNTRRKIEYIIGEALVEMSSKAKGKMLYLSK